MVVEITVVVVVLLCIGVVAGVVVARKRNLLGAKSSSNGRISFENPSYIREQNGDTVQVRERKVFCISLLVILLEPREGSSIRLLLHTRK